MKRSVFAAAGALVLAGLLAFIPSAVKGGGSAPVAATPTATVTVTAPASTVTVVTPAPDVPPAVPVVPVPVPPPPAPVTYTVKDGDTLSGIAFDFYGHSDRLSDIAAANNIGDVDAISVGQVLVIP